MDDYGYTQVYDGTGQYGGRGFDPTQGENNRGSRRSE
ncbi:hypothetical protein EST38_g4013 [Candolleomyces aberdarensis]|uniref:Uncharacterized protein n=1 Tax=Candolleomyces aberdarensis TaxID=2316362 RepID=A0A4Q2DNX7_9AGAR|nr:hypothetical protein EST38_g4013 [Candolleomyces aberdarensis]